MELELFQLNRKRLDEQMQELTDGRKSAVLLQGGKTTHFYDTDVEILFRQEPFFMWTFGVTIPDFYGALIIGHDSSALFAPKLPQDYEIWAGRLKTVTDFQNIYGVDKVRIVIFDSFFSKLSNFLKALIKSPNNNEKFLLGGGKHFFFTLN